MVLWGHTVTQLREGGQTEWTLCLSFLNLVGIPGRHGGGSPPEERVLAGQRGHRVLTGSGSDPKCVTQVQLMDMHQKVPVSSENTLPSVAALCNTANASLQALQRVSQPQPVP